MTKKSPINKTISVIIPVFNEQENLAWLHDKVAKYLADRDLDFEIIFVDDGSNDGSLAAMKQLHTQNPKTVRYLALSRNFGKEAATSAGLSAVKNDAAIIMDADGQHPVELIDTFLELWHAGNDVVVGIRTSNINEGFVKKYGSKLFYAMLKVIGGKTAVAGTTDFRLIDRKVIDSFNQLTERNRVTRNLIDWLGYQRVEVPFEAAERHAGQAAYSFQKLLKLALNGIVSHSTRPLKVIALLGLLISTLSAILGVVLAAQKYIFGDPLGLSVTGSALLALFVTFLVGIVLVCQGLLALYIESVYYETQNRPLYLIKESS
ncbi:glycosyltransferase [Candidatus Saccharibacteria bacterium]|nr:MAG: glycosyltransferase [Candidatus Saccharibacteria bacterium]